MSRHTHSPGLAGIQPANLTRICVQLGGVDQQDVAWSKVAQGRSEILRHTSGIDHEYIVAGREMAEGFHDRRACAIISAKLIADAHDGKTGSGINFPRLRPPGAKMVVPELPRYRIGFHSSE